MYSFGKLSSWSTVYLLSMTSFEDTTVRPKYTCFYLFIEHSCQYCHENSLLSPYTDSVHQSLPCFSTWPKFSLLKGTSRPLDKCLAKLRHWTYISRWPRVTAEWPLCESTQTGLANQGLMLLRFLHLIIQQSKDGHKVAYFQASFFPIMHL
jgi:hypothetical protein